jgi:hypothetical protein
MENCKILSFKGQSIILIRIMKLLTVSLNSYKIQNFVGFIDRFTLDENKIIYKDDFCGIIYLNIKSEVGIE